MTTSEICDRLARIDMEMAILDHDGFDIPIELTSARQWLLTKLTEHYAQQYLEYAEAYVESTGLTSE